MHVVAWDNPEETIIRQELSDQWTWDEFVNSARQTYTLVADKGSRTNLITVVNRHTPSGHGMKAMQYIGSSQPPNLRHTVFVTPSNAPLRHLIQLMVQLNGWIGPTFVQTLDEARAYLARKDREDGLV